MLAFNDIYRRPPKSVGGEFVDIWDGFVDENGAFVVDRPGHQRPAGAAALRRRHQPDQGRQAQAGFLCREAAEQAAWATAPPGSPALLAPASLPQADAAPVDVGSIDRTVPMSLTDPELDGGAELLGLMAAPKREAPARPARSWRSRASRRRPRLAAPTISGGAATAAPTAAPAAPAAATASPAAPAPAIKAVGSFIRRCATAAAPSDPISASSIARAACRPSRIAQTTSDWPRRTSPAANSLSTLVR